MSKIDILLLLDNNLEVIGGSEESTKIIIKGLKNQFQIGLVLPGEVVNRESSVYYFPILKYQRLKDIFKNPFKFLRYITVIKQIIKKQKPKIIHTQAQVSFFIVALLFKLNLIPKRIKFIHTERGLYTKYNFLIKKLFLFFMKELDILVTTTEFNKNYWKKALIKNNSYVKLKVIENTAGEIFETYDPGKEKNEDMKLVVGFAGRFVDWKNWPLAVEIVEKLNEKLAEDLHVKMVVGCLDKTSKRETLKMFDKLKRELGNRFEGMINQDIYSMDKFYYDIDIFILTSKYNSESFGRTLVEAMSRKTVVLTTNSGGSVEVVGKIENVLNNADQFVDRIMYFHNNRDKMKLEKQLNLTRVRKKYSLENNLNKHIKMYNEILN